jgi:hypothetical protein
MKLSCSVIVENLSKNTWMAIKEVLVQDRVVVAQCFSLSFSGSFCTSRDGRRHSSRSVCFPHPWCNTIFAFHDIWQVIQKNTTYLRECVTHKCHSSWIAPSITQSRVFYVKWLLVLQKNDRLTNSCIIRFYHSMSIEIV